MEPDKKEVWVAKTLASLEDTQRAKAPFDLTKKVIQRLHTSPTIWVTLGPRAAWRMAACAVFLLSINILTCLQFGRSNQPTQQQATAFAQEYFAFTPTLSL